MRRPTTPVDDFPPEQHQRLHAAITTTITATRNLNPPRRHRTYPRVIKRGRHNSYRVKKKTDVGIQHDGPATIKLANLGVTKPAA